MENSAIINETPSLTELVRPQDIGFLEIVSRAVAQSTQDHALIEGFLPKLTHLVTVVKPMEIFAQKLIEHPGMETVTAVNFLTDEQFKNARRKLSPGINKLLIHAFQEYTHDYNDQENRHAIGTLQAENDNLHNDRGVDELTQLPDKKYLRLTLREHRKALEYLWEHYRDERRDNPEIAVPEWMKGGMFFYFDLDHFKHINDMYGHGMGDNLLQCFAASVQNSLRDSDELLRIGGEEFPLFMAVNFENLTFENLEKQQQWLKIVQNFQQQEHLEYDDESINLMSSQTYEDLMENITEGSNLKMRNLCYINALVACNKFKELASNFRNYQQENDDLAEMVDASGKRQFTTFSAGVMLYDLKDILELARAADDEDSEVFTKAYGNFIKEADAGLYRAKGHGRSRLYLDMMDGTMFNLDYVFRPPSAQQVAVQV